MIKLKIYIVFFLISFVCCDFIFFDTTLNEYYHNYYSSLKNLNDFSMFESLILSKTLNIEGIYLLKDILRREPSLRFDSILNLTEIWDLLRLTEHNMNFYELYGSWIEQIQYVENDHIQKECILNYSILLQDILKNI